MSQYLSASSHTQIRGQDGTILWTGTAIVGVEYIVKNSDSTAFGLGEGVLLDTTSNTVLPRLETTSAGAAPSSDLPQERVVSALRVQSATATNFIGVTIEPIAVGERGRVLGYGSLMTVKTTTATIAVTGTIGGSSNLGLCASNTTPTQILGTCMKTNTGTPASPGNGTGSTSWCGILVSPR